MKFALAFTHAHAVQQLLWTWYSAASLYRFFPVFCYRSVVQSAERPSDTRKVNGANPFTSTYKGAKLRWLSARLLTGGPQVRALLFPLSGASSNGRAPVLYAEDAGSIPAAPIRLSRTEGSAYADIVQGPVQVIRNHQIPVRIRVSAVERGKKCPARTLFRRNGRFYNNDVSRRTGEFQEGEKPCFTL